MTHYEGRDARIEGYAPGFVVTFADPDLPSYRTDSWRAAVQAVLAARQIRAEAPK